MPDTIEMSAVPELGDEIWWLAEHSDTTAEGATATTINQENLATTTGDIQTERIITYNGMTIPESQLREVCPYLAKLGEVAFKIVVEAYLKTEVKHPEATIEKAPRAVNKNTETTIPAKVSQVFEPKITSKQTARIEILPSPILPASLRHEIIHNENVLKNEVSDIRVIIEETNSPAPTLKTQISKSPIIATKFVIIPGKTNIINKDSITEDSPELIPDTDTPSRIDPKTAIIKEEVKLMPNKLDLRKIARSQAKSARVGSGLAEGEVATSKEDRPLSAEISWSGDGGALRKSSITDDIEPVMTIEPLITFVTDTVADTEQDFDTQIETPNVGLFEEYLGSLEVIDTIGNLEEIRETASRQPIEKSLAELITLIQETSKTPEMQEITNLIQEIDQLFTVDNLRITEASPLAPEIEEKIIRLFELLGRRSPQDALDELIVRHDIDFLVQAIEYLTELANEDNQQEFLFSRTKTVIPANIIDPIAIRVGRIIVRLVKTGLKNLQPITVE
ncbi:hypothetical protein HY003_00070 [Candidatus Saccharibacteria bacterium]|nr:hypothetical protein [Candidatus Saccharibacteria bacterium]MBI3337686.1 hypothetical protein [Candidatus Saccharibacteria bacterium]